MMRALCLSLLLLSPALADVVYDGSHPVAHEILFEGLEDYPELTFVLYPASLRGGPVVVPPGEPVDFRLGEPLLYAMRGDAPRRQEAEAFFANPDLPRSEARLQIVHAADSGDPLGKIRTVYRVERIEGTRIELSVEEWTYDTAGAELSHVARHPAGTAPPAVADASPPADAPAADPAAPPAATPAASAPAPGGFCALHPATALPLAGLSALALCALVLVRLRRGA